jgi:hypothetical protein
VEETFLSSVRSGNGQYTNLAKQVKQEKYVNGNFLLAIDGTEIQLQN